MTGSKPTVDRTALLRRQRSDVAPLADMLADRFMADVARLIGCGAAAPWHGAQEFARPMRRSSLSP